MALYASEEEVSKLGVQAAIRKQLGINSTHRKRFEFVDLKS